MSSPIQEIREWLKLVLSWTDEQVIQDEDPEAAAPRPSVTNYVTVSIDSDDSPMSSPYIVTSDEDAGGGQVWQYHSLQRSGQLSMAFFGDGSADYARAIELSMAQERVLAVLGDDINVVMAGGVADQPILRSTEREPAATLGFQIDWVDSTRVAVDPAEGIEVEVTGSEPDYEEE